MTFNNRKLGTPPRPSEISEKNWSKKGKRAIDIPFMKQSHAESMKKILGSLGSTGHNLFNWAELAVLVSW